MLSERRLSELFQEGLRGVVWDWGDTLMRGLPEQVGPMADWPHVEAMPGAFSALRALSVYPVQCVASNATDSDGRAVAKALDRVGLREHLTHFFTSLEMGVSKPDPRFFEEISRKLKIPPNRLLAVGNDLQKDVLPAKAAGMVTVWVSSDEEPSPGGTADLIVPSLTQLAEVVRKGIGTRPSAHQ